MADGRHLKKMADEKTCRPNLLQTVGWIALKFDVVVLYVFQMIRLTLGENH